MGRSASPSHRKAKSKAQLARPAPHRLCRSRFLIVCEGSKTEPNYFRDLKDDLGLTNTDVEICGDCGSAPRSVVDRALELFAIDPSFDCIFCVFDKDTHTTYSEAIDLVSNKKMPSGKKIKAIKSIPCFEYWILLHFEYTCSSFVASGGRSAADNVVRALKRHMPNYRKSAPDLFSSLKPHSGEARKRSAQAIAETLATGSDNPSSEIHILIDTLAKSLL